MTNSRRICTLFTILFTLIISACGGGGGGGGGKTTLSSSLSSSSASVAPADTTPDTFSFSAITGAALNSTISSTAVTISGINTATPISITGGEYSISGGAFTGAAGSITNGQTLVIRLTSAAVLSTSTQATVTIGGVAQTFSVTTELPDTTPNPLSFNTVTGAPLNLAVTSVAIPVSGINLAVPISITGGEYSINGGAFTSTAGTVTNGQTVALRLISAATGSTGSQATVTISGIASVFSVTTIRSGPLNIAGVVTTLAGTQDGADGIGTAARFDSPSGAVIVGSHLYVADRNNHKIRKIVIATGVVTTLAGSGSSGSADGTGAAASFNGPVGITTDGTHLYVADSNSHRIRKIVIATGVVTTLAGNRFSGSVDGTGAAASFYVPYGITTDGTHLYVADTFNNKIRKIEIATGAVTTLAGAASGDVDGTGAAASFNRPQDITADGTHLYVADTGNNKIRKIEIATGVVTTLAGSGSFRSVDGTGAAASFYGPYSITTDGTHLYVTDTSSHKIRKIVIATGVVTTLAGAASGDVDGTGAAASFNRPQGITTDGTHLYVADTYNHKIRKIVIATGVVTTLAGALGADGTGAAASFNEPQGITTDGTHLFVADTGNYKIRKIEIATGVVTTLAGSEAQGFFDGTGVAANFFGPQGITTDGTHLYVADTGKIRKIEIATGVVTTLAGNGSYGSTDGVGAAASFNGPTGITNDGTHLYVADTGSSKIRKIEMATGAVTTLAGAASGDVDGTGAAASFNRPQDITADGTHLYVADTGNNKIRKIEIATGVVTTLAGSNSSGSADGTGAAASFSSPRGITTDSTHLYVTDTSSHKIRKIVIATGVVTTLAGSGLRGSADGVGAAASFYGPADITTDGFSLFVTDTENSTIRKIE
jgi:sugar lactone lactonase YvrE